MQPYPKPAVSWFLRNRNFIQMAVGTKASDEFMQHKPQEEQQVTIKTCGSLYEKWKKEKKFRKVPDGNLTFNVSYLDTSKEFKVKDSMPVVLALHGAPGSYRDFDRMIAGLSKHGIRVIAPNFPDFTVYKPGIFRYSADEKAHYVKDFLKAINVSHLDLLICHSGTSYTGLNLCVENESPTISGLALFNPGPFCTSLRGIQPWPLLKSMVYMSEFSVGLKLLEAVGSPILKLTKFPLSTKNIYNSLLTATTMCNAGIVQSKELYWKLSECRFPIFIAFSEDDRIVQKELCYDLAYNLGLRNSQIFNYDKEGTLIKEGEVHRNVKVLAFKEGSHYVFSKHSKVLNEEILKFLHQYIL